MNRIRYPEDHWIRSRDTERSLQAYLEQQSKTYSKTKNRFIRSLLGNLRGSRFLDYGCGAGLFVAYGAAQGASAVLGIDAEETVLAAARLLASREGVGEKCEFLVSQVFPAFSSSGAFHTILIKDVLEHVPDDAAMIRSASRALTPDGALVLSTQNAFSLNYLIEGSYHRLLRGNRNWYGWDRTHLRFYTPRSLQQLLRQAGLKPVAWRSAYIVPHKIPAPASSRKAFYRLEFLSNVDHILGSFFPWNRLGWNILVKAVKEARSERAFAAGDSASY
ncbi:class I SAM-dependent methyltransferase [Desulfatirhabdium butyrativorans]|uniref:class I SAM-dependent methyltransferase n=1 Tax=Desulfatirhabdium butyrativorans TaxID=340467 RepID=UPI00041BA926|nr:methyltransferase domain-containing protein [Desulfatirhabdium butyrativorans]